MFDLAVQGRGSGNLAAFRPPLSLRRFTAERRAENLVQNSERYKIEYGESGPEQYNAQDGEREYGWNSARSSTGARTFMYLAISELNWRSRSSYQPS